jgi:hypothetical protein
MPFEQRYNNQGTNAKTVYKLMVPNARRMIRETFASAYQHCGARALVDRMGE